MSALSSKEDSDRLIRDLMKKTKDLEKQMVGMKQAHADGASALQEALADRAAMAEQFGQLEREKDSTVRCHSCFLVFSVTSAYAVRLVCTF